MTRDDRDEARPEAGAGADGRHEPPEGVTTERRVRIGDSELDIEVTAAWTTLRKDEEPVAELFHVAYLHAGASAESRPVTFVFNGGPGASSAYLHVGALGPRRVAFDAGGTVPPPPVRLVDNPHSWLTFTDLVFIDPVGTGFSRAVPKPRARGSERSEPTTKERPDQEFLALNRDLDSLGEFIQRFLSEHGRWTSPVFIAGESYGGFRAAKLSKRLQEGFGVGLCGAVLISPALEWSQLMPTDYEVLHFIDAFPTIAATAHFHGRAPGLPADLPLGRVLERAEAFATRELAELLVSGELLEASRRVEIVERMAQLTGMPADLLSKSDGRLRADRFARELLRDRERICGMYDATVTAHDPYPDRPVGEGPDPTLFSIERLFTAGINALLRAELGVRTERDYRLLSLDVNQAWKLDTDQHVLERHVGATDDVRYALSLNEHLEVLISHGSYDLVTPYFASERLVAHMKLRPAQRSRVSLRHFRGGHMFYTLDESRAAFRDTVAELVGRVTERPRG